jgi:ribosome biogenesis GTPase
VLQTGGGVYEVLLDDQATIQASLRGRLKLEQRTGDRVVAGDRVILLPQSDASWTIEDVEPRTTELARRAPGRGAHHRAKILVANVDQVAIVFAAARPEPHLRMLDRFLVQAESNHLAAFIIVNKTDLVPAEQVDALFGRYERAGYAVLRTSTVLGTGIDAVRDRLCHRESVLAGPSGAGKSSLLNTIEPGLGLRIGEVSSAVGKGRHTTVTAVLIPLACGGFVADTPGLRELALWDIDVDELDRCFPEFAPFLPLCRFGSSCTHTHEPDCAVRDAVAAGAVDRERYDSYAKLFAEP